jgi:hypothetical protein
VVRLSLNVSGLEQTVKILANRIALFHLDAPSSQAGARNAARVRHENPEAQSSPKQNFRPPQGETSRRIP